MRPRIEIDKYFFIIGAKRSIFTLNLLGRIPEKCMGRHVEMDKRSIVVLMPEGGGFCHRIPLDRPGIKAEPRQNSVTVTIYPFLHTFPFIFLGCDRVNL